MFFNLFGAVFHIRLPLKQGAFVSYLEVLVSGNFNICLHWKSYQVFFKLKKLPSPFLKNMKRPAE